jgi:hypothetical protein
LDERGDVAERLGFRQGRGGRDKGDEDNDEPHVGGDGVESECFLSYFLFAAQSERKAIS